MDNKVYVLNSNYVDFFNSIELTLYDGNIAINLIDLFPLVKQGYAIFLTVEYLVRLYCIFNQVYNVTHLT